MDSPKGRKRPWEEDSPIDSRYRRRDSSTAATYRRPPPLPQYAGRYSHDNEDLGHRRLPPLYTPTCDASAGTLTTSPILPLPPSPHRQVDAFRPRSQSLFDTTRQWPDNVPEHNQVNHQGHEQNRSLPPIGTDEHRPQGGSSPAPHAPGKVICCPSGCQGQDCLNTRALVRKLAAELLLLDSSVKYISQKDYSSSSGSPDFQDITFKDALQWALDLVQWTSTSLRDHIYQTDQSNPHSPSPSLSRLDTSSTMRRGQHHLGQREEQSPPTRPYVGPHPSYPTFAHPGMATDQSRNNPYGSDMPPIANSPHHTTSSSGSTFMPPQSPMHAPQPSRPALLPSPSSMNFPIVPNLASISPPSTAVQTSAQATHMQDLQHQVSVKTLTLQTLQREYDSLLQKLERQRTKCATLEKKFEVSDAEINSLTDEKEKLQAQVVMLESNVEELQQSRDDTRRQLVANGAQYMRIMEMANRLQAQSAEDKKRWDGEKVELQQRIQVLEEAMVTGTQRPTSRAEMSTPPSIIQSNSTAQVSASSSSTETINVLRAEIGRLRIRTQSLETALQTMKEESVAIQAAAQKLVESGGKIEKVTQGAMGG